MTASPASCARLDWKVAGRPLAGEVESGDAHAVAAHADGVTLAVIDGLGHGPEAAEAARVAVSLVVAHAGLPLRELVRQCHEGLRRTRGVVLSVASFDAADETMSWIGVGNVEGTLIRGAWKRETLVARGGVVGYQLPSLNAVTLRVTPGDTLIFATDGIKSGHVTAAESGRAPQDIASDILEHSAKPTDDALVLVARYLGRAS